MQKKALSGVLQSAVKNAPLLIEAAVSVLTLVKGRIALSKNQDGKPVQAMSLPELAAEVAALRRRAQAIDDAQLEQIKLIQQVVEQNRFLAETLHEVSTRFKILAALTVVALLGDVALLVWAARH